MDYRSCRCILLEPNTSLRSNEHWVLNLPGTRILMAKRFISLMVYLKMNRCDIQKAHGSEAPQAAIMFLIAKEGRTIYVKTGHPPIQLHEVP